MSNFPVLPYHAVMVPRWGQNIGYYYYQPSQYGTPIFKIGVPLDPYVCFIYIKNINLISVTMSFYFYFIYIIDRQWLFIFLTTTIHWINVDLTSFQSLRCWRDNKTALGRNLVHSKCSPNAGRIKCFSGALQSHLLSIESLPSGVYTLRNHKPSYGKDVSLIANLVQYMADCFFLSK